MLRWMLRARCGKLSTVLLAAVLCSAGWGLLLRARVAAADVKGQLVLGTLKPQPQPKPPRSAYNWELENGVKEVLPLRVSAPRELAVVLVGDGQPKGEARVEVAVSGGALLPSTLVLRTDSTLRIRNDDEIGHELFAEGLDGFSAEATSPGATRSVHLVKAGSWPLRDKLAPHADAYLHVLPDLVASAQLEANGSFVFNDVPAGKYTLKVFQGATEIAAKAVEVGDKPLTLEPMIASNDKAAR